MASVKPITVINLNGKTYAVDACSKAVQEMVELYNKFNAKAADLHDEVTMAVAAREHVGMQINSQLVREEEEAAKKAAEEATPVEPSAQ